MDFVLREDLEHYILMTVSGRDAQLIRRRGRTLYVTCTVGVTWNKNDQSSE